VTEFCKESIVCFKRKLIATVWAFLSRNIAILKCARSPIPCYCNRLTWCTCAIRWRSTHGSWWSAPPTSRSPSSSTSASVRTWGSTTSLWYRNGGFPADWSRVREFTLPRTSRNCLSALGWTLCEVSWKAWPHYVALPFSLASVNWTQYGFRALTYYPATCERLIIACGLRSSENFDRRLGRSKLRTSRSRE